MCDPGMPMTTGVPEMVGVRYCGMVQVRSKRRGHETRRSKVHMDEASFGDIGACGSHVSSTREGSTGCTSWRPSEYVRLCTGMPLASAGTRTFLDGGTEQLTASSPTSCLSP